MSYPEAEIRTVCTSEKKLSRNATAMRPMAMPKRRGRRLARRTTLDRRRGEPDA